MSWVSVFKIPGHWLNQEEKQTNRVILKAIVIANGIRILKNCYGFFITWRKNWDDRNQTSLNILICYYNIENVNLIQSWLWVVVDNGCPKWVFFTNLTRNCTKHEVSFPVLIWVALWKSAEYIVFGALGKLKTLIRFCLDVTLIKIMISNGLCGTKIWLNFNIGNFRHSVIHGNICQIKQKSVML